MQKLRWGRPKDIEDARDVLAVQTPSDLDMDYIQRWCVCHQTANLLTSLLEEISPLD